LNAALRKNKKNLTDREYKEVKTSKNVTQLDSKRAFQTYKSGLRNVLRGTADKTKHYCDTKFPSLERNGFTLKGHQREAIGLLRHYCDEFRCALLADQMGLGKTLTLIGFMLDVIQQARIEGRKAPFLVVCPASLISMWQQELKKDATLKVVVVHGAPTGGDMNEEELSNQDVVLTSYDTLMMRWKKIKDVQIGFHYAYTGMSDVWEGLKTQEEAEIKRAWITNPPKGLESHRKDRPVVPLFGVDWECVIADEAHNIRNSEGRKADAMRDVVARYRVACTGTPMQNGLGDLQSIWQWMQFDDWGSRALFNSCFKPRKKPKDRAKRKLIQLILTCISRANMVRRLHSSKFQEKPVSSVNPGREVHDILELDAASRAVQERVKRIWDKFEKALHAKKRGSFSS
jgi:SNF2 family DNA or RNA helicase